jgi:hypothetical protein
MDHLASKTVWLVARFANKFGNIVLDHTPTIAVGGQAVEGVPDDRFGQLKRSAKVLIVLGVAQQCLDFTRQQVTFTMPVVWVHKRTLDLDISAVGYVAVEAIQAKGVQTLAQHHTESGFVVSEANRAGEWFNIVNYIDFFIEGGQVSICCFSVLLILLVFITGLKIVNCL